MLAFLMDHHIRSEITDGLLERGIDVLTALDDGSSRFSDEGLLARATTLDRVLVSRDQDLLVISSRWQQSGREFAGLVFAVHQDIDIGGTIEHLELIAHVMTRDEMRNHVEYIPARR